MHRTPVVRAVLLLALGAGVPLAAQTAAPAAEQARWRQYARAVTITPRTGSFASRE